MTQSKPQARPARPEFSAGPTVKRPGWSAEAVAARALLGRSHRSAPAKAQLQEAIDKTRAVLEVPAEYRIGIVPASDTGAVEMAMWSMLGCRPVDVMAWESFGQAWVTDAAKQLKLDDLQVLTAEYGALPDLSKRRREADLVFTWNGTTSGARVPDADFIAADREGVTICDATSAAFAQPLDWPKLDVTTFSWQKVMGGEAAHGMLILSPRAVERLESYAPDRALPKIFRLTKGGKLNEGIFRGETINTVSMWCVADYLDTLDWGASIGGLKALHARADESFGHVQAWIDRTEWAENLAADPATRSNTGVCFKVLGADADFVKRMTGLLSKEGVAHDIANHRDAPPSIRIWCGASVEPDDVKALLPWLDWAYAETKAA